MIDHTTLYVSDFARAKEFYTKALAPLGYSVLMEFPEWNTAGFGAEGAADFWLNGKGANLSQHIAFMAADKAAVDAFYKEALDAGGKDNGAPGYRTEYSPGYYGAFILDLDGHNIETVFHDPVPV